MGNLTLGTRLTVNLFGLGLLCLVLSGCPGSPRERNATKVPLAGPTASTGVIAGVKARPTARISMERSLDALTRSMFYASDRSLSRLSEWMTRPEAAPIPLVLLDKSGDLVPWVASDPETAVEPRLECQFSESIGARVYYFDGAFSLSRRVGDFGAPKPPLKERRGASLPPGSSVPILDHLSDLPLLAHQVHGIGWAYTQLDDLALTEAHSLRDQLGLAVNPQLIPALESTFGAPTLFRSPEGDLALQFSSAGLDYYKLITKYHFVLQEGMKVRLPGVPSSSDGIVGSVQFLSESDPGPLLAKQALMGGPIASRWTWVAQGWSSL